MQAHPLSSPAARSSTDFPFTRSSLTASSAEQSPDANLSIAGLSDSPRALAHDAGNLLLALGLYSDLLRAPGVLQPQHRHYADELHLLGTHSTSLLSRMIRPAMAEQNSNPPTTSSQHGSRASDVLRHFAPLLHGLARPFAAVSVKVDPHLPPLPLAAEMLERILTNLVRNAAEAIASTGIEGGAIRVRLTQESGQLCLRVSDDGPGMSPAVAAAFISPDPLPAGAQRGLGHRIIHELITETAGTLSVQSARGRGTRVTISWPFKPTTESLPRPGLAQLHALEGSAA